MSKASSDRTGLSNHERPFDGLRANGLDFIFGPRRSRVASLTFYGGVEEIGGNKILLEDAGKRIWFDFGMSFKQANKYFAEFLQPKKFNGVVDFLDVGLLPRLSDMGGFYRDDYLNHAGIETSNRALYDAVFLTHAHADHSSYIHFLRREIPIYASNTTKQILAAIEMTSTPGFNDFTRFRETFKTRPKKSGAGLTRVKGGESEEDRDFGVMEEGKRVSIGDIVVEAVPVNHSLPGACGYIIHTTGGALVYTGDLRFHGYGGELTRRFIERAAEVEPATLVCEGTRIGEVESITEQDVQEKVSEIVRKTKNLVIVNYPPRDIERMRSFYEVAKNSNPKRKLVVSLKQAYLLRQLEGTDANAPSLTDDNVAIYIDRKGWGLITKPQYPRDIVEQDYAGWEREFLDYPNTVTCEDIRHNQSSFIIRIDFFELTDLIDLKPSEGSCYIRSVTEPHDEEDAIELGRVEEWLKLFNLYPYEQVHASGHASGPEIKQLIQDINPKVVYPIHTEHPESFDEMVAKGTKIEKPERGKKFPVEGIGE